MKGGFSRIRDEIEGLGVSLSQRGLLGNVGGMPRYGIRCVDGMMGLGYGI